MTDNQHHVRVKICGITTPDAALAATQAGADDLGFVHFNRSPRHLTFDHARALRDILGNTLGEKQQNSQTSHPRRVGVMVNPTLDDIINFKDALDLDTVQLHGQETTEFIQEIKAKTGLRILKAIGIKTPDDLEETSAYSDHVDAFLFDAKPERTDTLPGGNARQFSWDILQNWQNPVPWYLAGGLSPENVAAAITASGAQAVDVSSGVENSPGVKSNALIKAFIYAAKGDKPDHKNISEDKP